LNYGVGVTEAQKLVPAELSANLPTAPENLAASITLFAVWKAPGLWTCQGDSRLLRCPGGEALGQLVDMVDPEDGIERDG
ncbi:hypothetical protein ACCS64_39685, partial [Rhizobium ruizarguesonis]